MEIEIKNHQIMCDSNVISNFSIRKVEENKYFINNGQHREIKIILKSRNINHFKHLTFSMGNFYFTGNTKQLHAALDLLDNNKI